MLMDMQHRRDRQQDIHQAHEYVIYTTAVIARNRADNAANGNRCQHCENAERQAQTAAVDDAGEHIAAIAVRAEPVLCGRRLQALRHVHARHVRIIIRDPIRADSQRYHHNQNRQTEHRQLVFAKAVPNDGKLAALFVFGLFLSAHLISPLAYCDLMRGSTKA